jgi:hypothetical protein
MRPAEAVNLAVHGAPVVCTSAEYPEVRAALAEARELNEVLCASETTDANLTEAINALQREHLR